MSSFWRKQGGVPTEPRSGTAWASIREDNASFAGGVHNSPVRWGGSSRQHMWDVCGGGLSEWLCPRVWRAAVCGYVTPCMHPSGSFCFRARACPCYGRAQRQQHGFILHKGQEGTCRQASGSRAWEQRPDREPGWRGGQRPLAPRCPVTPVSPEPDAKCGLWALLSPAFAS